ncbi:hypothetical protein F4814DRAFT_453221 [Daldinia grandis]|nr:hypothetical protein F4814DRAFT_453221 [Daldinia grandis]
MSALDFAPDNIIMSNREAISTVGFSEAQNGQGLASVEKDEETDEQLSPTATSLLILSLTLSTFIAAIEQTIVATAVPTVAKSFQATELEYVWIGKAYLLPAAGAL